MRRAAALLLALLAGVAAARAQSALVPAVNASVVGTALDPSIVAQQAAALNPAPSGAANSSGLVYASTAPVVVNSSTSTSVFPPGSASARTLAAGTLKPGRAFALVGGGVYTVPTGNLLSADITLKVGAATIVAVTTPAAPVGSNAGIDFHAECVVQANGTTMLCTGVFTFAVLGTSPVVVPFNSITAKTFDPTVANTIDVLGDWNGMTTTHATTVQTAALMLRN